MASKNFGLSDRHIKIFNSRALQNIRDYCHNNYCTISEGDVDVVCGGYEKWLKANNFQIIDLLDKNTQEKKAE